jgi:hypothetical protein
MRRGDPTADSVASLVRAFLPSAQARWNALLGYGFDANLDDRKLGDSMIDVDSRLYAIGGVALQWTGCPVSDPSPASCCQVV